MKHNAAAIITAGGIGRRMGHEKPKQFLRLNSRPILIITLEAFLSTNAFTTIVLVVPKEHISETQTMVHQFNHSQQCQIVAGGTTRQDSVKAGLDSLPATIDHVVVHDGVRPLVSQQLIIQCLETAEKTGAAIAALPVNDTVKSAIGHTITSTIDRKNLWRAQTPQAVKRKLLIEAYEKIKPSQFIATDEASLLEHINCPVSIVEGSETNIKITLPEDIQMAEALITNLADGQHTPFRTGHGYDAHRLVKDRPLILGGVNIPHPTGLLGHSDADVVTHALCDALLGATGKGDIGKHFPDSDPQYKGINSLTLLEHVSTLLHAEGFILVNADITIIAQQPKLADTLPQMQKNFASSCKVSEHAINIKATTTETMGFTGREEGIACHAVVLMSS